MSPFDAKYTEEYLIDYLPKAPKMPTYHSVITITPSQKTVIEFMHPEDQRVQISGINTYRSPNFLERALDRLDKNSVVTSIVFILAYVGILNSL